MILVYVGFISKRGMCYLNYKTYTRAVNKTDFSVAGDCCFPLSNPKVAAF